jgi:hypothetical protein
MKQMSGLADARAKPMSNAWRGSVPAFSGTRVSHNANDICIDISTDNGVDLQNER